MLGLEAVSAVIQTGLALIPVEATGFAVIREGAQQVVAGPRALVNEVDKAHQAIQNRALHHMLHAAGGGFGRVAGDAQHFGQEITDHLVAFVDFAGNLGAFGRQRDVAVGGVIDEPFLLETF